MKKGLVIIAVAGGLATAATALGGLPAATGVNGSLHDMTKVVPATADTMGRVCVYCHSPHNAASRVASSEVPLWNHTMNPDSSFTPYTWASSTDPITVVDPLIGPSRLCMSCHDGSIAVDEHGAAFGQTGDTLIGTLARNGDGSSSDNLTRDLGSTHPIGFNYNEVAARRNALYPNSPDLVVSTSGYALDISTDGSVLRAISGKRIADNLYRGDIMTCATCHDVHNKENATQDSYEAHATYPNGLGGTQSAPNFFLYAKEMKSLICFSCHIK